VAIIGSPFFVPRYYRQLPASQAAEHTVSANISGPWRLHTTGSGGHRAGALRVVAGSLGCGTWAGCAGHDCTLFAGLAQGLNSTLALGRGTWIKAGNFSGLKSHRVPGCGTWAGYAMPGIALLCGAPWRSIFIPGWYINPNRVPGRVPKSIFDLGKSSKCLAVSTLLWKQT